jgi:dipeptidyl aminopeptidase/acylaminoacyl peptidase
MTLWQKKNADVKSAVALSPILDIAHMRQHKEADFNRELTQPFFGNGENDAKYSPATYAAADSRPALMLFGTKDYDYLIEQARVYAGKFSAAGLKQVKIDWVQEADHSDMVMNVYTSEDKVSDIIAGYIAGMKEQK